MRGIRGKNGSDGTYTGDPLPGGDAPSPACRAHSGGGEICSATPASNGRCPPSDKHELTAGRRPHFFNHRMSIGQSAHVVQFTFADYKRQIGRRLCRPVPWVSIFPSPSGPPARQRLLPGPPSAKFCPAVWSSPGRPRTGPAPLLSGALTCRRQVEADGLSFRFRGVRDDVPPPVGFCEPCQAASLPVRAPWWRPAGAPWPWRPSGPPMGRVLSVCRHMIAASLRNLGLVVAGGQQSLEGAFPARLGPRRLGCGTRRVGPFSDVREKASQAGFRQCEPENSGLADFLRRGVPSPAGSPGSCRRGLRRGGAAYPAQDWASGAVRRNSSRSDGDGRSPPAHRTRTFLIQKISGGSPSLPLLRLHPVPRP